MKNQNRNEIINNLLNMGYAVHSQDGILYFFDITFSQAKELVTKLEYRGSYGVRQKKEEM